ncbi:hypothetical protein A6B43_02515 [Vespertiliibacter pulmonis]|uniref:Paraquat-inducible protein B n=1 Tax=Vespertiliibacter pulmonis TaxID=1443036 RepID=A0A3N4VH17_9PAST|nr:MlaD family protein [Vespertiliibacter pulmonis]QLB20491.1 hypothetical protein A6B43_02515 [Vespertiliibacter pulmonis]RPE80795.1 paraquat-inducible protein B [Vespertiliibacter pulmonis]
MSENTVEIIPAKVRPPRKISPFWLLPLIAFLIGSVLFFQILQEQGEKITIRFQDGAGISAGKTAIRFQGLQIGLVKKVNFTNAMREVEVTAEISPEAKDILRKDTKFWLVRPSASLAGVSGLDALVSGNYISLLPGESNEEEDEFIAETEAPLVPVNDGDLLIKLIADDLGSITVGANVYFRKVPVGTIADYRFTDDQRKVEIDVVINKKYTHLVKQDSHFWNISGLKFNANFNSGISLEMDSLLSVVQGAVAFDSPVDSVKAKQEQTYQLFSDIKSAKRGIEAHLKIPTNIALSPNETALFYQGVQIGILSNLETPPNNQGMRLGTLLIDPNYQDLLRSHSAIVLKQPKFNLNKEQLEKFSELFRGNYLELIAGDGEPKLDFIVQKNEDYQLNRPENLSFSLTSPQSYGVDQGQGVYYHDVKIGEILKRDLTINNVKFSVIIFPDYRHLIGENSKFITVSNLDLSVGLDGFHLNASSPAQWVQGGIRLLDGNATGEAKTQYPLYKDVESAENGVITTEKKTTLTLSAKELSGISQGSVLLYRNFQVGEVLNIRPQKNNFEVDIFVEPKYRHLVSEHSRFWIEPAVQVDLSARGLNLQASPLMRTLKGAISFDNNGAKNNRTLYANVEKAHSGNTYITLTAKDASKLSEGMPLKYMGLTVGKIETLTLDNAKKQVKATAFINGQYYPVIAKAGSKFSAISPEISTTGLKNLDAVLQNYINIQVGNGKTQTQFALTNTDNSSVQFTSGFPIIIETSNANGIVADAPILYRGMQVGAVQRLSLSELGDRVLIYAKISNQYRHLVRKNSQFWAASGYTMDISLSGASINSGTMSQLLNGGITFSTPSGTVVQPQAEANQRFRLQRKTPEGALGWDQGVAE